MKCITCNVDIPPQWVACVQQNTCPACSGPIMDEVSKELLTELKEAMSKMPNDPEGLAGWILSNYSITKIGTGEPTQFHRRSSNVNQKFKTTDNPAHDFFKRAGVNPMSKKTKNYQELVNQIESGSVDEVLEDVSEDLDNNEEEFDYQEDKIQQIKTARNHLNNIAKFNGGNGDHPVDLSSHPALNLTRLKQEQAQEDIASGIKKPNSFSRH